MDLNEIRKQLDLFDEVVRTTDSLNIGDTQMQQEVLHPNPRINLMLLANKEKRARLKALGIKETHKRKPKKIEVKTERSTINNPSVSTIVTRVVEAALVTLRNLGCVYKVSLHGQTWQHGVVDPIVEDVKSGRGKLKNPDAYGDRSQYIRKFTDNLKIGTPIEVPFNNHDPKDLQSTLASLCIGKYGVGAVATHMDRKRGVLEVLRKR
jgi:hypothetical protein